MSSSVHARSVIDQLPPKRTLRTGLPGNGSAFPLCTLGAGSSDRLRNDYCETLGATQENQRLAVRLSQNVMAMDPNFLTVPPSPVSRPPDVIGAAYVITRAASIIRPVANLDCNGARVSGISWAVARTVTAVIWSVPRISSISPFTSACTERGGDQNQNQYQ